MAKDGESYLQSVSIFLFSAFVSLSWTHRHLLSKRYIWNKSFSTNLNIPNSRKQNVTKEPAISPKFILAVAPNFASYVMNAINSVKRQNGAGDVVVHKKRSSPCFLAMDDKLEENTMDHEDSYPRIDVPRSRYPYCIVWTPIPVLTWVVVTTLSFGLKFFNRNDILAMTNTLYLNLVCRWLFPFIGHMGIAMSSGVIRDFAGPFYVSVRILDPTVPSSNHDMYKLSAYAWFSLAHKRAA